jgi:hypothetical protein
MQKEKISIFIASKFWNYYEYNSQPYNNKYIIIWLYFFNNINAWGNNAGLMPMILFGFTGYFDNTCLNIPTILGSSLNWITVFSLLLGAW